MSSGQCSCPDCGTILRIRDRSFAGRTIDCPECHADLLIEIDENRTYSARHAPTEQKPGSAPQLAAAAARVHVALVQRLASAAKSPLMLAWAIGIGLTAFFAIVTLRPTVRFQPKPVARLQMPASADPESSKTEESEKRPPSTSASIASDASDASDHSPTTEASLPETTTKTEKPMPVGTPTENTSKPDSVPPLPLTTTPTPPVAIAPPATPAIAPPKPEPPPPVKIDVESKLKQRLVAYKQTKPVSEVIETIKEMLGVPIDFDIDELGRKNLDKPVTIELEDTTVGGVLNAVLDGAGWRFVIEDNGIRLKPRRADGSAIP
jgi:hypothetical protein